MLSIFTGASLKYVIPEFASGLGKQLLHFQHIQKSAAGKVMLTNDSRRTLYFLHFLYLLIWPFIGAVTLSVWRPCNLLHPMEI